MNYMQGICSRHSVGAIAERYILRHHHKTGKVNRWYHRILQPQSLSPVTHILHQGCTSYSFPNSSDNWRANIQMYTANGVVLKPPHYLCAYMIAPICLKKSLIYNGFYSSLTSSVEIYSYMELMALFLVSVKTTIVSLTSAISEL